MNKIQQLIIRQRGEMPEEVLWMRDDNYTSVTMVYKACDVEDVDYDIALYVHKRETQFRAVLERLIDELRDLYLLENIEYSVTREEFYIEHIKAIETLEQALSLTWSEIVEFLESGA